MAKTKTHFEQVPLKVLRKIAEQEPAPELLTALEQTARMKKAKKDILAAKNGSPANSSRAVRKESSE